MLGGRTDLPPDAHLPHAQGHGRGFVRHLCMQPGGFFVLRDVLTDAAHAVPVAGARRPETGRRDLTNAGEAMPIAGFTASPEFL